MKAETADHKLQGIIVAFYTDYRNNQTLTIPPGALTTVIYNLPKATIKGIEAEFIARPFGGLSINGNVGLLWTKLDAPGVFVAGLDRKSVVKGKSVSVRVDLGGRRIIKKKTKKL